MCHDQYGNALKGRGGTYSANNIEWEFEELQDGWIAIYEVSFGERIPRVQAKTREFAEQWCDMHERPRVLLKSF